MSGDENSFAKNTIPLLQEYSQKLVGMRNDIHNLKIQICQPPVNQPHIMEQRAWFAKQLEARRAAFPFLGNQFQILINLALSEADKKVADYWLEAELRLRIADAQHELEITKQYVFS